MSILSSMLSAALFACLFQNLIFSGGYGADEAIRMAAKPKQLLPLSLFIMLFSTVASLCCVLLDRSAAVRSLGIFWHALIFTGVLAIVYLLALVIVLFVVHAQPRTVRRLGIAAFNTLVLAVPFINYRAAFGPFEALGAGIGAGLAFLLAVLLISFGLRAIQKNESIPVCFRGTPAVFLYAAILALTFTGITGRGFGV